MKEPKPLPRGRPELPPEERRDHTIRVRATAEEAAKFERLGGAEWLRAQLKKAKDWIQPKGITK
jgi:hypothetical protein